MVEKLFEIRPYMTTNKQVSSRKCIEKEYTWNITTYKLDASGLGDFKTVSSLITS